MITSVLLFVVSHKEHGFVVKMFPNIILRCIVAGMLFVINLMPILFENRKIII